MLTQRRDHHSSNAGFTVVELLVVMVLLGVVGTITLTAVISSLQASSSAEDRMRALNDLQSGVERVGRELRAAQSMAPHLGEDPSYGMSATITRDGDGWRYDYYLDTDDNGDIGLFEDIFRFDADGNLIEQRQGIFITDIANLALDEPVFEYYHRDGDGNLEPVDCDEQPTRCATAKQVRLTLWKNIPDQDPMSVETVVNVRNMRYDLQEGGD